MLLKKDGPRIPPEICLKQLGWKARKPNKPFRKSKSHTTHVHAIPEDEEAVGATWGQQCVAMGSAGAVLGPLCDAQHSRYGVLQYTDPIVLHIKGLDYSFETCWWTPVLFSIAAIILGISHPALDKLGLFEDSKPRFGMEPSVLVVLAGIICFVLQYWSSGVLESQWPPAYHCMFLAATGIAHWLTFDHSKQGLFMACLTAIGGPAIEVMLIQAKLYHYANPSFLGIPLWIPFVYFCGSPAVGNLGRAVLAELKRQKLSNF